MDFGNKHRVRQKILGLVKEFVTLELINNAEIPQKISDFLLKDYGWANVNSNSDIDEFVEKLEEFITNNYKSSYEKDNKNEEINRKSEDFLSASNQLETVKNEYFENHLETIKALVRLISLKIEYSRYLKNKSGTELLKVNDVEKRVEMLKLQSLSKLYGESNAFEALVVLKGILEQEKRQLELSHDKLVQQNINLEKLKDNKEYCELLKTYKELLKQEKKLDSMDDD